MKVYIASSWRNTRYEEVCAAVRAAGHEVMDWRGGDQPLPHWGIADERFAQATRDQQWTAELAADALSHDRVMATYAKDMILLNQADALVLLTPCGRSAHFEAGYAHGRIMPCAVLLSDGVEPEVMTAGMQPLQDLAQLVAWLDDTRSDIGPSEPAPITTDELAALAEARGLRLVEPEHLLDLGAARAEGAAAEREACALIAEERSRWAFIGAEQFAARGEAIAIAEAIRARSKECSEEREALATAEPMAAWSWSSPLGCFIASKQVVELRAYPDGHWWVWESGQSKADGRAGNMRDAMLCAVTRERQDTRDRSDCQPELDEWLARLEGELVAEHTRSNDEATASIADESSRMF